MTAQVIAIRASTASSSGWSQQELAEVFRLGEMLHRHGLDLAMSYGVSDEGDPWLVLTDPLDAEINFHVARIDQRYIVARGDGDEIAFKRHLREVAEVLLPVSDAGALVLGSEKEPLELYAVVALAIAGSQSLAQLPEAKQAVESMLFADRDASGRDSQRDSDDRIGDLARVLIAAINAAEPEAGRTALLAPLLLASPIAAPAVQPSSPAAAVQRLAMTLSLETGQLLAPAQRDLASAQSMIAGLVGSDGTSVSDWHHDAAAQLIQIGALASTLDVASRASELEAAGLLRVENFGAEVHIGVERTLFTAGEVVSGTASLADPIATMSVQGAGSAVSSPAVQPTAPAAPVDLSSMMGLQVSIAQHGAAVAGSRGFDLVTVSGHSLLQLGEFAAIVTITSGDNIIIASSAAATLNILDGHNSIVVGSGTSVVNIGGGSNSVAGGSGAQSVNIQNGTNQIVAGSGPETVNIAGGTNTVVGGSNGSLVNIAGGTNSVSSGSGQDTVNVTNGQNTIQGSDTVHVSGGVNTVLGGGSITIDGGRSTIAGGGSISVTGGTNGPTVVTIDDGVNSATSTLNGGAHGSDSVANANIGVIGVAPSHTDTSVAHGTT